MLCSTDGIKNNFIALFVYISRWVITALSTILISYLCSVMLSYTCYDLRRLQGLVFISNESMVRHATNMQHVYKTHIYLSLYVKMPNISRASNTGMILGANERRRHKVTPSHWLGTNLESFLLYSISQEICTRFLLCCALLWLYIDWFSHIHQAYFTGTVAI